MQRDRQYSMWSSNSRFAPGYPVYNYVTAPPLPIRHFPRPTTYVSRAPERYERLSPPPPSRTMPRQVYYYTSLPKKKVHFSLAPDPLESPRRQSHVSTTRERPATPADYLPRQPSRHNLHRLATPEPTIWIITYANTRASSDSAVHRLLNNELLPDTPHLYTIRASDFRPPPSHICDAYSGISDIVQEYVMQDPRAQRAVSAAVEDIIAYGRRQLRQEDRNRRAVRDVALSVCCQYGTHRSVSIAERIAQRLMGLRLGVKVRVRHVHRQRGSKEAH